MSKRFSGMETDKATEMIRRNGGTVGEKQIHCSKPGLKVLAAIDYLVNFHKYRHFK